MSKIVLSGIQPTGKLHLGNYLGAIKQWLFLQEKYTCYFFIADYHSLTETFNPQEKRKQIIELTADLIALGINPKKSILFLQSMISPHTELCWIFNCLTPISYLFRMTQFKDKSQRQKKNINMGLFDYPVLQAADILIYKPNFVPVGKDQLQHLELTRKIARRFNKRFGKTFPEPKPLLTPSSKIMSLLEPSKKMSKSLPSNHNLFLTDPPPLIKKKIRQAVTGTGQEKEIPLGIKNLFLLLEEFAKKEEINFFKREQERRTIKYQKMKEVIAQRVIEFLNPFQTKRNEILKEEKKIEKILKEGEKKALKRAKKTLEEVKRKIGII